jgi:peptidoglycan/xylan/chitin deacetylase (PgdA/CDA1 family)
MKEVVRSLLSNSSCNPFNNLFEGIGLIVLYHRIIPPTDKSYWLRPYSGLVVTSEELERQIAYFAKNFECVPLDDLLNRLTKKTGQKKRLLVVTFDDGFKDNLELGLPILEKYNVPATFYITTGLIDNSILVWWEELQFILQQLHTIEVFWGPRAGILPLKTYREKSSACDYLSNLIKDLPPSAVQSFMESLRAQCSLTYSPQGATLSWDEIRSLDQHTLITIGAHSTSHHSLKRLPDEVMHDELAGSKQRLEKEVGHPVHHFSYPYGCQNHVGERELAAVEAAGFRSAVTTLFGHVFHEHDNYRFGLPRISIDLNDSLEYLKWKMTGSASFLRNRTTRIVTIC